MLSYILLLFSIVLLLFNYKKGVLITAFIFQPLTYIGSGIGEVNLYYVLAMASFCLLFVKKNVRKLKSYPKLLMFSTTLMACSYLVTNSICRYPNTVTILANILSQFIFPAVLWCVLDSAKTCEYSVKLICFLAMFAFLVMIPEQVFRHNYFTDLLQSSCYLSDFVIDTDTIRYGLKRTNSIFSYFSTCGVFCCLSSFIFWIKIAKENNGRNKYFCLLLIVTFMAFSTGSRAVLLAVFSILIGLYTDRKLMHKKIFKIFFVACIFVLPFIIDPIFDAVDSIVNSDDSKTVSGSSSELRMMQWAICYPYFMQSPIWGNGRMFIWNVVAAQNPLILGAESIWFSLSVDYGIMGILTYCIMILCCSIFLYKIEKRLIFLPICYFLILFISPDTGIQYNQLLSFSILAYKMIEYQSHKSFPVICQHFQ